MAAPRKKTVSTTDIRRLMKEKSTVSKSSSRRIDHPLAKYNSLQQLVCVLCNNVIKNDLLWSAHILSKQHKERALSLKAQGPVAAESPLTTAQGKRKTCDSSGTKSDEKKRKTDGQTQPKSSSLPSDFFDDTAQQSKQAVKERAKAALLAGYSSSDSDGEDEGAETPQSQTNKSSTGTSKKSVNGLPTDFFDGGDESDSKTEAQVAENKKMADVLPEGFFDDPKMDAKVRNVEYKDKGEEEWELFQKSIKEEAQVSEIIMEEEDEQVNIDRNIDEIDDQMQRWQEVENLHVKKETILKSSKSEVTKKDDSGNEEDDDDEDLDDMLDWRAKKSVKNK